jgi:hypothetical protein
MTACWTHCRLRIAFHHPGASSMVQRDENHSVPDQGCREDDPVPPNCSAVTTHACGWLCVAWRYRAAIRRLFAATQVVFDMTLASTSWRWISAGDIPFSRRNLLTLRTSMFDHISASPAILQLMLGQSDWYEARSSVRERKQCSTCSDLAGNLNEIRNTWEVLLPYLLNRPRIYRSCARLICYTTSSWRGRGMVRAWSSYLPVSVTHFTSRFRLV